MQNSTHNLIVALTGSLGSGKSTAARMFGELGAEIIKADDLARVAVDAATVEGRLILTAITEEFGKQILDQRGELKRKALGAIVFADAGRRKSLEKILHPAIRALASEAFRAALAKPVPLGIYDVPLFFEAGLDRAEFKAVIVVKADARTCIKRVMARDSLSEDEARKRLELQLPIDEKVKRADYVLDNSGSEADLRRQVQKLFQRLTRHTPGDT